MKNLFSTKITAFAVFALALLAAFVGFGMESAPDGSAGSLLINNLDVVTLAAGPIVPTMSWSPKRAVFNKLQKEYGQYDIIISEDYLRVEQAISNSKTSYKFNVKQNQSQAIMDRTIRENDLFLITHIGIFLGHEVTANGIGATYLNPYVNGQIFATGAPGTGDPDQLQLFYNSNLFIQVDSIVYNDNGIDTRRMLAIPETQQSTATNLSQIDGNASGMLELEPQFFVSGTENTVIQLNTPPLPSSPDLESGVADTQNLVYFYAHGFTIVGGNSNKDLRAAIKNNDYTL